MEILIVAIGIVVVLALILAYMNRRSRRTGRRVGLNESGISNDRWDNDTRAQQP